MKEFVFKNVLNSNIEIKIKANYYSQAIELLFSVTKYVEDYKLIN